MIVAQGDNLAGEPFVLKSVEDRVATLTLNRPAAFNVLSVELMTALRGALADAISDGSVGAIILRAEGKGFCAGHDLKEIQAHRNDRDGGRGFYETLFAQCTDLMQAVLASPKPVIAEVQGIATAAGCQLVASCDLAVASNEARFGVNGIDVGFFCSTPMVALSRNIGAKKTFELLTTGRLMPADEACSAGLINRVVQPGDLRATAHELATSVAGKSSAAIALGKRAFYEQLELSRDDAYGLTSQVMVENLLAPDAKEGIAAFIEKRKPRWEGR